MTGKNIIVFVYVHNNSETIEACLNSIISSSSKAISDIIVIDDGSLDGSGELLEKFSNIKITKNEFRGIAKSINEQLRYIGDNDLVRINGGVIIKTEDWIEQFQTAAYSDEETGIVGARLLLADDRIESDGRNFINGLGYEERHININAFKGNNDTRKQIAEVDSTNSAFCYYKNEVIRKIGGFDENYFPFYTEDDDYCISARKNNFKVVVNSFVQAYNFTPIRTPDNIQLNSPQENFDSLFFDGHKQIQEEHFKYWKEKWLWDLRYPDLNLIRNYYGNTKICWNIGEKLRYKSTEEFPTVDICIVTWNNLTLLKRMMDSLAKTDYPADKIKIYITDNGSTDGTVEYLKQLADNFVFKVYNEFLPINTGVTVGMNLAIVKGNGELVARCDDDIVLPANWLKELAKVFHKRPFCGMTGPKILNDSTAKSIQTSDFKMLPSVYAHENETDNGQVNYFSKTVHIKGCCNLYRRDVFKNSGLLDIRYSPTQYDDPDHHIAVLARGYEIIYNGFVEVIHKTNSGLNNSYAGLSNGQGNQFKLFGKWGQNIYNILDQSIENSFENRTININEKIKYPAIDNEKKRTYAMPQVYFENFKSIIDSRFHRKETLDSIVKLLINNATQLFNSNSITAALSYLHTALSIYPSKILTIIFLNIAYYKLSNFNKANHFKNLASGLNKSAVDKLIKQNELDPKNSLSTTITQFNKILENHSEEDILEKFITNGQFDKVELAFTIFMCKET